MIDRAIAPVARLRWTQYPVLTITGPRQSGKTTLARTLFPEACYVNLELPDLRAAALADPRDFLARHPPPAIFDEVQFVPSLLAYIQAEVDEAGTNSRFVLTGSHQPALRAALSESLAGRTGLLELLPLSLRELAAAGILHSRDEWLYSGFQPRLQSPSPPPPDVLYADYFRTYVERDVRQLVNLRRLAPFETFLRCLAGRVGQLLNVESLASDVGVSPTAVRDWLSVLEASYVVFLLRPYYRNFGKRFVKSPKVYFTEPGLAAWLLGIREPAHAAAHPLLGALFENLVVADFLKDRLNAGLSPDLWFMRTSNGLEADLVVEDGPSLDLYEIKAGTTFHPHMAASLRRLRSTLPGVRAATVIYAGEETASVSGTTIKPFQPSIP
jgi:hypothetical protein